MNERQAVRNYYGFQIFFNLLLWAPIFYEYQRRIGLGDEQIFSIQSIYYTAFCLFEIPTGMIADRLGYRRCLRAGAAVLILCNLLPVVWPGYIGFLWHFLLVALSRSLISGASSAWLYEYLSAQGGRDRFKVVEGNARAYGLFVKVGCWAAVGYLMAWKMSLPYTLSAAAAVVSLYYSWVLPDVSVAGVGGPRSSVLRELGPVLHVLAKAPKLPLIMFQGVAIFVLARIVQLSLFQPILSSKKMDVASFGTVMAAMTVFEALGARLVRPAMGHWVRISDLNLVYAMTLLMATAMWVIPAAGAWGTVTSLGVFSLAVGWSYPAQRQLVNDAIPLPQYRATLLSMESILDRGICAVVASAIGGFVSAGKMNEFLKLSSSLSVLSVVGVFLLLKWASRERVRQETPQKA